MARTAMFSFRLYVADDTPNSAKAIANLTALCRARLFLRNSVEIVDVLRHPELALTDGIVMTPTLVKLTPLPVRRIVGTLSQMEPLLRALGLDSLEP